MPIPLRTLPGHYHYHAYQYPGDAAAGAYQLSLAQPTRHHYRFYSLKEDLAGLVADGGPGGTNVPNIAITDAGVPINADGYTYRTRAIRFGNLNNNPNAPTVLLTGGIHAREWIAAEITYLIAEYLVKNYSRNPQGVYQTILRNLVNTRNIIIAPMLNPSGNWATVFSGQVNARRWRKNRKWLPEGLRSNTQAGWGLAINHVPFQNFQNGPGVNQVQYEVPRYATNPLQHDNLTITFNPRKRGVDGNRNCNTPGWGYETQNNNEGQPTRDSYFGTTQQSETETQNLAALVNPLNGIAASIDYHSYSELIIIPTEAPVSWEHRKMGRAMRMLITCNGSPLYGFGTPMQTVGYNAVSSVMDYLAHAHQSHSFTIELDPDNHGQGYAGFDLAENLIMDVFEKNIRGALALIAVAGGDPTTWSFKSLFCGCCGYRRPWARTISQFNNWNVAGRGNRLPI